MTEHEDTVIEIKNNYMEDTLDGVRWNGDKEESRNFTTAFTEVLRTLGLTGRSKLIIKQRFLKLYNRYKLKLNYNTYTYNTGRVVSTVFGIIIPALITLDNELNEKSNISKIISYTTFSLSIVTTIINAMIDLFQLNKKTYTYSVAKNNMETEGWLFLTLSGKYHKYNDHNECWRKFLYKIEKINMQSINSNILINEYSETSELSKDLLGKFTLEDESKSKDLQSGNIIYVNR